MKQRKFSFGMFQAEQYNLLREGNLFRFLGSKNGGQPRLRGTGQIVFKLFAADHQTQHIAQLTIRAEPLVTAVVFIKKQIDPCGKILQHLPLGLIAFSGPEWVRSPQFFPFHGKSSFHTKAAALPRGGMCQF